ncbi:MAG: hypothetical protein QXI49_07325 [Candidatus Methanomethylicaceae archaeon]
MMNEFSEQLLKTAYLIKINKNNIIFLWSSTPYAPLRSSIDLKIKINPNELFFLANDFNCQIKDNKIFIPNLELYNRLLIYACVRPSLKKTESIHKLSECIYNMTSWDAHYWASAFRELWWKYRKRRNLLKTIKGFKLFFGIE